MSVQEMIDKYYGYSKEEERLLNKYDPKEEEIVMYNQAKTLRKTYEKLLEAEM